MRTILIKYQPEGRLLQAMSDFRDIVNHLIGYATHFNITSDFDLRDENRDWFLKHYSYAKHWLNSASTFAIGVVRSWRELGGNKPHLVRPVLHLDQMTFKFKDNVLRLTLKPREFIYIPIKIRDSKYVYSKLGELTITMDNICLAYQYSTIAPSSMFVRVGVDSNYKSLIGATERGEFIETDLSSVIKIQKDYTNQREKIQKQVKNTNRKNRLLARNGKRQRDKSKNEIHVATKQFTSNQNHMFIQEDLTKTTSNLLKKTKGKTRRKTLSRWSHSEINSSIKSNAPSLPDVNPKGTSKYCAFCNSPLDFSTGYHTPTCPNHGKMNRDRNAAVNILVRGCGGEQLPPTVMASLLEQSVLRHEPRQENRNEAMKGNAGNEYKDVYLCPCI